MIGRTISHFEIKGKLGEGGMGKVYLATDIELQRKVALKFLLPQFTEDENIKSRFKIEARTMAALNHPNITTIYEVGEYKNSSFIAMEYVEGQSLDKLLRNKNLTLKQTLDIVIQLCEGLKEAHKQSIIHRDIKPGNLLLESQGRLKILDFGLAKLKEASKISSKSSTVGTLYYLSPEQIQNKEVDQRADIFATGILLYELLTGQVPFKGDYEAAVLYSIINEQPEPLAHYKSSISENLQRVVDKALVKNPDMRYQSADELLSDLKQEISDEKKSDSNVRQDTPTKQTRKLAAIMFTDIVGYSRMMGKDEEATIKLLEDYVDIVSPTISRHQGQILKKIGDGLFCEFSSAIDAVECSLEIQKSINDYNEKKAKKNSILVRIGIHVGDVIKKDNDLFGDGVNVAARIEPLAPPGGIYVSDSVHSAISSHPKYKIKNIGLSSLKNIEKQHNLYQILTGVESSLVDTVPIDSSAPDDSTDKQNIFSRFKPWESSVGRRTIMVLSLGLILIAIISFQDQLYNLYDSLGSLLTEKNASQSIESNNDDQVVNSEVSEILKSEQSVRFTSDVFSIKIPEQIVQYLKISQDEGKLTFGRKDQISDLEETYVIIFDEKQVYTILLYYNAEYFDTNNNQNYNSLSEKFRGKRSIWIKLLKY
jgi:serine/threonine protein kinase